MEMGRDAGACARFKTGNVRESKDLYRGDEPQTIVRAGKNRERQVVGYYEIKIMW